jgi:hypothetical protein
MMRILEPAVDRKAVDISMRFAASGRNCAFASNERRAMVRTSFEAGAALWTFGRSLIWNLDLARRRWISIRKMHDRTGQGRLIAVA